MKKPIYNTHGLGCISCLNYSSVEDACFVNIRYYTYSGTSRYKNGMVIVLSDKSDMFKSVIKNITKIEATDVFPKTLMSMNTKLSCPFHSLLRKDFVEADIENYIMQGCLI